MKIACVGEITVDHYLDLEQQFIGGISLNFAVHSKRSGAGQVSLVSCVGTDTAGQEILTRLAGEGIDATHVAVLPGKTASIDIQVTETGERVFPPGGFQSGVLSQFRLDRSDLDFVNDHDIVVMPLFRQIEPLFRQVIRTAHFSGKRVVDLLDWSDFGRNYSHDNDWISSYLDGLDLVFISGDQTTIETLLPMSRHFPGLIVITLGAVGSVALVRGQPLYQPALDVTAPIDTTGCGDAFQAAFTVSYFRSGNIPEALYQGAKQAARVVQHYGAI